MKTKRNKLRSVSGFGSRSGFRSESCGSWSGAKPELWSWSGFGSRSLSWSNVE